MRQFFSKYFMVVFVGMLCFSSAKTQTDTAFQQLLDAVNLDEIFGKEVKKSSFKIQTSYLTNYVYGGRKDTATLYPYFTPSLEYTHKSGFFVGSSFSFLTNDNSRLDATNIELGYSTDSIGKFSLSAYLNKSFYNSKSQNVQSDVGFTVGAQIGYDAKIVNLIAAPSLMIGSNKDFALSLSVEKLIYLKETDKSTLSINLNIATYFGGTGFYQSNKLRGRKNSAPQQGATLVVTSPKKFQMLSYEFGLPIYFDKEKWGLFITPTYAVAVNPVVASYKIVGPNGNSIPSQILGFPNPGTVTEKIENSFFAEIGVYYKF